MWEPGLLLARAPEPEPRRAWERAPQRLPPWAVRPAGQQQVVPRAQRREQQAALPAPGPRAPWFRLSLSLWSSWSPARTCATCRCGRRKEKYKRGRVALPPPRSGTLSDASSRASFTSAESRRCWYLWVSGSARAQGPELEQAQEWAPPEQAPVSGQVQEPASARLTAGARATERAPVAPRAVKPAPEARKPAGWRARRSSSLLLRLFSGLLLLRTPRRRPRGQEQ